MGLRTNVLNKAIELKASQKFVPTVSPSCADFVSYVLRQSGWNGNHITYVPYFFDNFTSKNTYLPGDIVIFEQTYDANNDGVINKKDDMTHIGIMINLYGEFVHFSNSQGKVAQGNINDVYWKPLVQCFLSVPESITSTDVKPDIKKHWAYASYKNLVDRKILVDTPGEDLNRSMSKGEICTVFDRMIKYVEEKFKVDITKDYSFDATITIKGEKK